MVKNTSVAVRPNKVWPLVVGVCVIALFLFLSVVNKKHATESGDNIHKFANGGTYRDGSKCISYNRNHNLAYGGSSSNTTFLKLFLPILLVVAITILSRVRSHSCSEECLNCPQVKSLLDDIFGGF
ncbi:TGBp2 [Drakaea virus A]|uniref:TGBp2 n=1 Tax=Drakaea virus A TaxID=1647805 RepID=A0A0F7KJV1_9VIRU|nr:TGBp2 [Drakaea virus A]AKH39761.1 TGBp2 [Drakaea virus A]